MERVKTREKDAELWELMEFYRERGRLTDWEEEEFVKIFEFLHSIDFVYGPYGRPESDGIVIFGEVKEWFEKKSSFDSEKELNNVGLNIKTVAKWYWRFSEISTHMLGGGKGDWMQLWKTINWSEKKKLEGDVRKGVGFLSLALVLKKFIEDHIGREILDVDEIMFESSILDDDPTEMNQYNANLRSSRNVSYTDPENGKNHYYDEYKMRFYRANKFGLNYQPKVMLFVEGKTEEEVFPMFFKWCYGKNPDDLGIEIVNFEGVDKLLSTAETAEKLKSIINRMEKLSKEKIVSGEMREKLNEVINELKGKKKEIVISNWTSFLTYNLEKWQIIPFFVSDNEGNIKHFLEAETPLKFNGEKYNMPERWKYLWGISNGNEPFKGKDFEFANFSDDEIALAISEVLGEEIDIETVRTVRDSGASINAIHDEVKANKRRIGEKLFENLFEKFKNDDESVFERPIFEAIERITEIAMTNHLPVDKQIEIKNKEQIETWLRPKENE